MDGNRAVGLARACSRRHENENDTGKEATHGRKIEPQTMPDRRMLELAIRGVIADTEATVPAK
jgi:hypothetical protein